MPGVVGVGHAIVRVMFGMRAASVRHVMLAMVHRGVVACRMSYVRIHVSRPRHALAVSTRRVFQRFAFEPRVSGRVAISLRGLIRRGMDVLHMLFRLFCAHHENVPGGSGQAPCVQAQPWC